MNEILELINKIPIRHDWISMIILCGWVQGFFLSFVFIYRSFRSNSTIQLFGWLLFFLSALLCDGYLCYTGLIKYVPHLNDSTEVLTLLLGPFVFLFVKSIASKETPTLSLNWIHFAVPVLFFLVQLPYLLAPIQVKLNAYVGAYFPDLELIPYDYTLLQYTFLVKDEIRWFILWSLLTYIFLSAKMIFKNKSKFSDSFLKTQLDKYSFSNVLIILFIAIFIIVLTVFLNFESDLGDYIISVFLTMIIFLISFFTISQSKLFDKSWVADKYDTSGLQTNHQAIFQKIQSYFEEEKYFLQTDASLQDLAEKLNQPSNYISQSINQITQQNFNEFINSHRIEAVKTRLGNPAYQHLNIVGIGQSVGFKSKSAFYAAFKKQTKMTPTQFLANQKK